MARWPPMAANLQRRAPLRLSATSCCSSWRRRQRSPGEDLPVQWHIEGWSGVAGTGEFELVLLFTPGYRPSGATVPSDYIYPGAELRIPVSGPDGTVTFQITGDDQEPFRLLAGVLRVSDGELMSTASVSLPDPRYPEPPRDPARPFFRWDGPARPQAGSNTTGRTWRGRCRGTDRTPAARARWRGRTWTSLTPAWPTGA